MQKLKSLGENGTVSDAKVCLIPVAAPHDAVTVMASSDAFE
jgi:hypothetical protein